MKMMQISKLEKAKAKKVISQINNYTSIASAKKASRDTLIKELEVAIRNLQKQHMRL